MGWDAAETGRRPLKSRSRRRRRHQRVELVSLGLTLPEDRTEGRSEVEDGGVLAFGRFAEAERVVLGDVRGLGR
jgi:hypothetical protein